MRPLFLSLGACILVLGAAWAQNAGDGGNAPQLPVGQTFKQFEWPIYQEGTLKATLDATEAKGITLNRAETTVLKIQIYDNGAVTTTVTSPRADLYVAEQKMRTKNTVRIERSDMEATSQNCDFDLKTKKYLMRTNVKVTLKHFDLGSTPANGAAPSASAHPSTSAPSAPSPAPPQPARSNTSVLDSPGSYADTNSAPIPPPSSETK
jgi:flagellar basal body rod protein FlgB